MYTAREWFALSKILVGTADLAGQRYRTKPYMLRRIYEITDYMK